MLNHNINMSARRFELQAFVDVINTADAFKLSKLSKYYEYICVKSDLYAANSTKIII